MFKSSKENVKRLKGGVSICTFSYECIVFVFFHKFTFLLPSVGMLVGGCDVDWVESASVTVLFLVDVLVTDAVVDDSN